ncbi:MAG TPA: DHH family phosphoesterase [Candidatus Dormibacteraeota bacterium]|nr:DHH family phosphoesterase [Candidatus Dormibacteraeota bacterium]
MIKQATEINKMIDAAQRIVIVQADNPDADSLASALALEQILDKLGKEPYLYCGVDMPGYLTYLPGWDRVQKTLPTKFDASIIVDTAALSLLETLEKNGQKSWLASKPCVIIDHHVTKPTINFASIICIEQAVATGEIIYDLAKQLDWPLNMTAQNMLATSIMSDSLGLVSEGTTAHSIHIIAELVEGGVKLAALDSARRDMMRKSPELQRYKGHLLQRIEYFSGNRIATITIPWSEIERYSPSYNPSMLVIDEMRLTEGTDIAIAFKTYKDDKITAKIRCNFGKTIAAKVAEHFGGGGHPYASGFKCTDGRSLEQVKTETIKLATKLLDELNKSPKNNETL